MNIHAKKQHMRVEDREDLSLEEENRQLRKKLQEKEDFIKKQGLICRDLSKKEAHYKE